jgi:hypothetical protein
LAKALRHGDKVSVTLPGEVTVKGIFVQVSPDLLMVQTPEGRRDITVGDVNRVRRTRMGFLLGAIIGAGAGAGLGAVAAGIANEEGSGNGAAAFLTWFGIGLAAGAGIDAMINLPRTVYERDRHVAFTPLLAPKAVGGALRVTF